MIEQQMEWLGHPPYVVPPECGRCHQVRAPIGNHLSVNMSQDARNIVAWRKRGPWDTCLLNQKWTGVAPEERQQPQFDFVKGS
ncbi:hypothetical protein KI387_004040, partial [Taxus chinensis]